MKFESILRESHEADENAIAHLGFSMLVGVKEVVLPIHGKTFARQLSAVLTMVANQQFLARLAPLAGVREEAQGELPIGQLTDLPSPLQGGDAVHDSATMHLLAVVLAVVLSFVLFHVGAKITILFRTPKDYPCLGKLSYFPASEAAAPHFAFPAVRVHFGGMILRLFLFRELLGLIISHLAFLPLHF